LYDDFISAFSQADEVILADIYDVRTECDRQEVDMKNFADDVSRESSVSCLYGGSLKEIEKFLKNNYLKKGDVLVCMGAGTITELADIMVGNE
ncbi:MAG: hypothetical protein KAS32_17065, partial [Candidatus Peribacteraceae bacterium]|nr:hypothetical protein [Candidatus Peribacteraceae bacterium]